MRALSPIAFGVLVLATIAAFFVTQHLKVTTPLIAGAPAPYPAFINPRDGTVCQGVDHRSTTVSFYLLHRADDVDVYVVDRNGTIVATLASGRHMRRGIRNPDGVFHWDGRQDNGALAPDGTYYVRIALIHQGRTAEISNAAGPEPITVKTVPPRPIVTSVAPALIPQNGMHVTIRYTGNESRGGTVRIYRTDVVGKPRLVKSFPTPWQGSSASWNGRIAGSPAPAGTYLVGLDVTDKSCNTGHFPPVVPPAPGSTAHAGVTVRYLAAEPPLDPVASGSKAIVYVDSRQRPYTWELTRAGARAVLAKGTGRGFQLRVKAPSGRSGLYELTIRSGIRRTAVPLVVRSAGTASAGRARMLVVLPALTWQGENAVDDDGDGIPNTLDGGGPIELDRALASGLPAGLPDETALLAYLDKSHLSYDLTTDLGLLDGIGPKLGGFPGVLLAGSERWLPSSLAAALRSYVQGGGNALSLGIDSLRRGVSVQLTPHGPAAIDPTPPAGTDVLGARPSGVVTHSTDLIAVLRDGLGLFSGTSGVFPALRSYQLIQSVAPPAQIASAAGTSATQPSIIGYHLGKGIAVEVGIPGFGSTLAHDVDSQELVNRLWKVLTG